jgi:hypothetical protein
MLHPFYTAVILAVIFVCIDGFKFKYVDNVIHKNFKSIEKRLITSFIASLASVGLITSSTLNTPHIAYADVPATTPAQDDATPQVKKSVKLPSGVEYYDAILGDGKDVVKEGSSVQF